MFGLFKKKFDPAKDLDVITWFDGEVVEDLKDVPHDAALRLVTAGLVGWKRLELELVDVPLPLAYRGLALLHQVAVTTVEGEPLQHGGSWRTEAANVILEARVARVKAREGEVFRLVDPPGDQPTARQLLATLAFLRGLDALDEDQAAAVDLWRGAVHAFPGAAGSPLKQETLDGWINEQNFLCWLALARYDEPSLRAAHYEAALARSAAFFRAEFGVDSLPPATAQDVAAEVRALLATLLDGELAIAWGPERLREEGRDGADLAAMYPSPIVEAILGELSQQLVMLPLRFRAYFYEAPVRERLSSDEIVGLVAELYLAALASPARVLALLFETRNVLSSREMSPESLLAVPDVGAARVMVSAGPRAPVLSRFIADVGRRLSAGCSLDEIRAAYGLLEVASEREAASQKMAALQAGEDDLVRRWLGLDQD